MGVKDVVGVVVGTITCCAFICFVVYCTRERRQQKRDAGREAAAQMAAEQLARDLEIGSRDLIEIVKNSLQGDRLVVVVEDGRDSAASQSRADGRNGGDVDGIGPTGLGLVGLEGVPAGSTVLGATAPRSEQSVQSCENDWGVPPTLPESVQARLLPSYQEPGSVRSTPVHNGSGEDFLSSISGRALPLVPKAHTSAHARQNQPVATQQEQLAKEIQQATPMSTNAPATTGQDTARRGAAVTGGNTSENAEPQGTEEQPAQRSETGQVQETQNQQAERGDKDIEDNGKIADEQEVEEDGKLDEDEQGQGSDSSDDTDETPKTEHSNDNNESTETDGSSGNNETNESHDAHDAHEHYDSSENNGIAIDDITETNTRTNNDSTEVVEQEAGQSNAADLALGMPGTWPTV
ncbi:hypothetical protein QBC36DRAFT_355669 [Triangularia setosa]|uniref:Uncharacterized protein n=1 Tax=Triangularia setosa TaxID=2587417 RepID=A0AAN7A6G8_9PEZI|nr:hypothetical protein QBC36DRAFT_355669 [Podospora setosa]